MTSLDELEKLYSEYVDAMNALAEKNANIQGLFRSMGGGGAGSDICNVKFSEGVKLCLENCADEKPAEGEAMAIAELVLGYPAKNAAGNRATLMMEAVQGALLPIIPFLSKTEAQSLLDRYYDKRAVKRFLPSQKKTYLALCALANAKV